MIGGGFRSLVGQGRPVRVMDLPARECDGAACRGHAGQGQRCGGRALRTGVGYQCRRKWHSCCASLACRCWCHGADPGSRK